MPYRLFPRNTYMGAKHRKATGVPTETCLRAGEHSLLRTTLSRVSEEGLGFSVAAPTAFCAASCKERAGEGPGVEGGGGGGGGPLRKVGGEDERATGA